MRITIRNECAYTQMEKTRDEKASERAGMKEEEKEFVLILIAFLFLAFI